MEYIGSLFFWLFIPLTKQPEITCRMVLTPNELTC